MSSFVGHSLSAGFVFLCRGRKGIALSWARVGWLACLWLAAIAPDFDYFLPVLDKSRHGGMRVSNSMAYALIVPVLVMGVMMARGLRGRELGVRSLQITGAGLSHLLLDFLVGVTPLPLFWPVSDAVFKSPVGLLPSAGALDLRNIYLYRNLGIELGVLVPFFAGVLLLVWWRRKGCSRRVVWVVGLFVMAVAFAMVSMGLSR